MRGKKKKSHPNKKGGGGEFFGFSFGFWGGGVFFIFNISPPEKKGVGGF